MAKRYGSVIVFKEGVPKERAEKCYDWLVKNGIIEDDRIPAGKYPSGVAYEGSTGVHSFDDEYGGPVWYIP